jgi:acyl carrier protein
MALKDEFGTEILDEEKKITTVQNAIGLRQYPPKA